jgi:hypothetical protein
LFKGPHNPLSVEKIKINSFFSGRTAKRAWLAGSTRPFTAAKTRVNISWYGLPASAAA